MVNTPGVMPRLGRGFLTRAGASPQVRYFSPMPQPIESLSGPPLERVFVFTVWESGEATDYATVLPPEVFSKAGVAGDSIVGTLPRSDSDAEGSISLEGFVPNDGFTRFLQRVVAEHAPTVGELQSEAERVGNGRIYVVDRRTLKQDGPVPPEDILGAFQVAEGRVVPGSYSANPSHRLLTEQGFFHLADGLHQKLVAELIARADQAR